MPKKSTQKRMTARGKVFMNFEIEPESHDRLREAAIKEERSISAVLRRLIRQHFGLDKNNK